MWTGFERRVLHDGTVQVPVGIAGRVVLVVVDTDDEKNPACGSDARPHIRSRDPGRHHRCHVCEAIMPRKPSDIEGGGA